jgi:hypothetical protein
MFVFFENAEPDVNALMCRDFNVVRATRPTLSHLKDVRQVVGIVASNRNPGTENTIDRKWTTSLDRKWSKSVFRVGSGEVNIAVSDGQ